MNHSSRALYTATRQRAYLRSVTIVVPQSWETSYSTTDKSTLSPDIVIDHYEPNSDSYGNAPYAKHYDECGKPGEFVHYTDQYLTNTAITNRYGELGKWITWAIMEGRGAPYYILGGRGVFGVFLTK